MNLFSVGKSKAVWPMKTAMLVVVVVAVGGLASHLAGPVSAARANGSNFPSDSALSAKSYSLPMFFEPNEGQTDGRVKFLARGAGYGLFLTADEAVLSLTRAATSEQPAARNVIRMRLEGANPAPAVFGAQLLIGKSSYFIGNDPEKWRRGVPQFARVEYKDVYPGIDLAYYGKDGEFEYDFQLAPGAEPSQIALSFAGSDVHIESGELVLSTPSGDIRFRAPNLYQPGADSKIPVSGSYVQLSENKIGFAVGAYDHSRALIIDPQVSYSTYLGGTGTQLLTQVAVGADFNVYLAGSTTSANFPVTSGAIQSTLAGPQNIFIVKLTPSGAPSSQLLYSTYLGGSGTDSLAGIAVDPNTSSPSIYVAGSTSSPNFPTTSGAFQTSQYSAGTHGFLSKLSLSSGMYTLAYSTNLSADGTDTVTGLAVDGSQNAYLTGTTTSTLNQSNGFPANASGYQTSSNSPGNKQFFASMVSTTASGPASMIYSTYFGGGNFGGVAPVVIGGGIAVDPITTTGSKVNMYFTGGTNMQSISIGSLFGFPIQNAYQQCLNQPTASTCTSTNPTDADVFVAKINPNQVGQASLMYSTYLGGAQNDVGLSIAVDGSASAYVTGYTNSGSSTGTPPDWNCVTPCILGPFPYAGSGGNYNAFVAKVVNQSSPNTVYPLNYFTYVGGSGSDVGNSIAVDTVGNAHITGLTFSPNLPVFPSPSASSPNFVQTYQGNGDAFVATIATTLVNGTGGAPPAGDYLSYLGGGQLDQGTGIALDLLANTYIAGTTISPPTVYPLPTISGPLPPFAGFPITTNAFQPALSGSQPNSFLTELGSLSLIALSAATNSPTPNPVAAGTQGTFTFLLTNNGPDPATNVTFYGNVTPQAGLAVPPSAIITSGGTGSCGAASGATIVCNLTTLPAGGLGSVSVNVTPTIPIVNQSYNVTAAVAANGGGITSSLTPPTALNVVDFDMNCPTPLPVVAGQLATITVTFSPSNSTLGYNATITPSQVTTPAMVTSPTPTFSPTPIILSGTSSAQSTLYLQTVARPVSTGSLFRRGPIYATWLPIGGLSLVGLGFGVRRKRGRWIAGAAFGLLLAMILLLPSCSSNSSSVSVTGGTAAGVYTIKITGSAGSGAAHLCTPTLQVY